MTDDEPLTLTPTVPIPDAAFVISALEVASLHYKTTAGHLRETAETAQLLGALTSAGSRDLADAFDTLAARCDATAAQIATAITATSGAQR
jgi:hypothetical protein